MAADMSVSKWLFDMGDPNVYSLALTEVAMRHLHRPASHTGCAGYSPLVRGSTVRQVRDPHFNARGKPGNGFSSAAVMRVLLVPYAIALVTGDVEI